MVLLVLAVLWGIVLIPPALRNRAEARQARSVDDFHKRLEVLAPPVPRAARPATAVRPAGSSPPRVERLAALAAARAAAAGATVAPAPTPTPANPVGVLPPRRLSRAEILRRRRRVFAGLCLTSAATLMAAVALAEWRTLLAGAHLAVDVALTAYVVGLRRLQRLARERAAKVRYLPVAIPVTSEATDEVVVDVRDAAEIVLDDTAELPAALSGAR